MSIAVCPPHAEMERLFLGGLPEAEIEALEQHVLQCRACLETLEKLGRAKDTLASSLGGNTHSDAYAGNPTVADLVTRLKSLRPASARPLPAGVPMMIITCSACQKRLSVKEDAVGKKVKCPGCQQVMVVPEKVAATAVLANSALPSGAPSAKLDAPTQSDLSAQSTQPPVSKPDATIALEPSAPGHDPSLTDFLAPPQAGDELGRLGKYRILKILGHGGMGVVYQAEDIKLKRIVAIKAMLPTLAASASCGKRFLLEAEAMAAVEHDHIVRIYQIDEERGVPFMAMEFLKGESLDERLKRGEPMPLADVLRIGREIPEGLSAAHGGGLIHRDIKPGNIWLEAPRGRVKILDFGLARAASKDSGLTQQGTIMGTPAYMAPEQGRGGQVDARSDLFSLGVVLYRLCTGKQPFHGADMVSTLMAVATAMPEAPVELNAGLPPELSALVMKLLEKDPAQRVGSAAEVIQALTQIEQQPALERKLSTETSFPPAKKKLPPSLDKTHPDAVPAASAHRSRRAFLFVAVVSAVAAALLLVLLGGGVLVYQLLFRTSNGTLLVEVDGDADVRFKQGKLLIYDKDGTLKYTLTASEKNKDLPLGKYEIKVAGADGVVLNTHQIEMTKDGWKVRVSLDRWALAQKGPEDAPAKKKPAEPPLAAVQEIELVRRIPVTAARNLFYDLAVSAGGKFALVTRDIAPGVELDVYEVQSGKKIFQATGYRAAFLGEGNEVVVDADNLFRVYEAATGKKLREGVHGDFYGFRAAPGGKQLVYWNAKYYALFDLTTMKELKRWQYKTPGPEHFAGFSFSLDAKRLFLRLGQKEPWTVWDVEKNAPAAGAEHLNGVRYIHWQFPDGKSAAVEREGKLVRLDWQTGKVVQLLDGLDTPGAVEGSYSFDGRWYFARFDDGKFLQYRLPAGAAAGRFQLPAEDRFVPVPGGTHASLAISEDSRFAALLTAKSLYVLRLPTPTPQAKFKNLLGMEFVRVPKGKAWLGGGNGRPGDIVADIPQDFYLGVYEVTQEEWVKVMGTGTNPSFFARGGRGKHVVKDIAAADLKRFPVEYVSWNDCQEFIDELNDKLQSKPSEIGWTYRLPTQMEWEYACRGGPMTSKDESAFDYYGQAPANQLLPSQANFEDGGGLGRPRKVGDFPPNRLGLFDMHGNVWEWCADAVVDGKADLRVVRGGAFDFPPASCRAASRFVNPPTHLAQNNGLRVARVPIGKTIFAPDLSRAKLLYQDTFNDPKSGFFHDAKDDLGEAGYVKGKYRIKALPQCYRSCGNGQFADFACAVTGRALNPVAGKWGLNIFADSTKHGISVAINWDGKLIIRADPADPAKDQGPRIGPLHHPAIKQGEEANTLLVIVRGRWVEVYVNSVAVCEPFLMDRDITPAWSSMSAFGGKGGMEVEITRYTVWSAEGLPKAERNK